MDTQRDFEYITIFSIGAGCEGQNTLRFNNVTDLDYTLTEQKTWIIRFSYVSASTGKKHNAVFYKENISGISFPVE